MPAMRHYCTLFDVNYLGRGLALYFSLEQMAQPFQLHVFAFDDVTAAVLKRLRLPQMKVVSLQEFETPELLRIKPGRGKGEYCWTCTPAVIEHCLSNLDLPQCTYVDADLFFFSSPQPLFDEMGAASVMITDHRYTPAYDQTRASGRYCVQFMPFNNDARGRAVLGWWRERCIEWCFARIEDGKFGDQKYLDDWPSRFPGVHDLEHLGGGVAPWNVQQYQVKKDVAGLTLSKPGGSAVPLVFYHFHKLMLHQGGGVTLTSDYELSREVRALVYRPYIVALQQASQLVGQEFPGLDIHGRRPDPPPPDTPMRRFRRRFFGRGLYYPSTAFWMRGHSSDATTT